MKNKVEKQINGIVQKTGGYYFDTGKGEFLHADIANPLPAGHGKLVKVPAAAVIVAAPVISVAYVIFLPLAGIMAFMAFIGVEVKNAGLAMGRMFKHETG